MNRRNKTMAIWLLIVVMLYKPTTLGSIMTPVAMILSLLTAIYISYSLSTNSGLIVRIQKNNSSIILPIILYYSYCFFLTLFRTGEFDINLLKALVSIICLVISLSIIFSKDELAEQLCKTFIIFLCINVCSYCISTIASIGIQNVYNLRVFSYTIPIYGYEFNVYFPITFATGRITIFGHQFLRLSSMFRECGIAQLFYVWALSECEYYFKNKRLIKMLLVLGVFFCFSTAGYACLAAFYLINFFTGLKSHTNRKELAKQLGIVVIFGVMYFVLDRIPGLRLADKNIGSIGARFDSLSDARSVFLENPIFGTGKMVLEGTSLTFLQTIYIRGIIGVFLFISIFWVAYKHAENKQRFVMANIASILTFVFSQPIWEAPLIYLLLVLPYKNNELSYG